jgi:hypothetical protein
LQHRNTKTEEGAESLLIITGTMGSGKSAALGEASDVLTSRGIIHAAIDLDAFGLALLPKSASADEAMYSNLRSVYANYAGLGVRRFLLARAIEEEAQLELCRKTIPAARTVVCRLTASMESMKHRMQIRETGMRQGEYLSRVAKLNLVLERAHLEDFCVANENRPLTDVAVEMLMKAGWIAS